MSETRIRALALAMMAMAVQAGCASGRAVVPELAAVARPGELAASGRTVTPLVDGARRGLRVSAAPGEGAVWLEGVELETGVVELDVRGKDVFQQSFLGVAFAGGDERTYEAIYLRPFNFRAEDPVRRDHAVQYVAHPAHPWMRLRAERPEVFENPVVPAPDPSAWVRLRVVVERSRVSAYVGDGAEPDLVVERLGTPAGRRVGLWVGNASDGDFANLRVTPAP